MKLAGRLLAGLLFLALTVWGMLVLYYGGSDAGPVRTALAVAYGLAGLGAVAGLVFSWRRWVAVGFILVSVGVWGYWNSLRPTNDRNWQPEVAVPAYATIDGDRVSIHNIRDFDYHTENDFTPHYYDRAFDLRKLDEVDLFASYWMGPTIAHLMVSFGFEGDKHVVFSIEARKVQGEGYSTIKGFFRQYELFYVVADERDVIRLRTNFRRDPPEQVYLYRLYGSMKNARHLFLAYIHKINELKNSPEFYNTLTDNCSNGIWLLSRVNPGHVAYSWKILLSGYAPEYLYEEGRLDTSIPFSELKRRSHINARARAADGAKDFSTRIRAVPSTHSGGPDGRTARNAGSGVHPQPGASGPAPGPDELVALNGHPAGGRASSGPR